MADLAPAPQVPERAPYTYEEKIAPALPGKRGPLRFEEGIATDTSVPDDFIQGMNEGAFPAPGRPNHVNSATLHKPAAEVLRERAHLGSAAWVDSPAYLGTFAEGAGEGVTVEYVEENRSGGRYESVNASVVED